MFNAAFVSCWIELPEADKKALIGEVEKALDGQKIPEIAQTLLNLAEFMEHCDTKVRVYDLERFLFMYATG